MKKLLVTIVFASVLSPGVASGQDIPQTPPQRAANAVEASRPPKPITPPTADEVRKSIERGVAFLISIQEKNGAWGSPRKTKGLNIYAPVPGAHEAFRAACTALGISALTESFAAGVTRSDEVLRSLERGEAYLLEYLPKVRRATPDAIYNVWAHGYGLEALAHMRQRLPDDAERVKKIDAVIHQQYDMLDRYESVDGGWGYYDFRIGTQKPASSSTPFTTASILIALHQTDALGVSAPRKLVFRGVQSIARQQNPDLSYLYGEYLRWWPHAGINQHGGSLGRSQACNLALRLWGDQGISDDVLKAWLNRLYARNLWLDMGRKRPVPHESYYAVAGYFYYFGHYYAAMCIDQLKPQDRPHYQHHLAHILLALQEKDGSWWDYPFYDYHQQYGTAFALMTLQRCKH